MVVLLLGSRAMLELIYASLYTCLRETKGDATNCYETKLIDYEH